MAPEQVRGEAVDSRTDLFALGILLYELATGRRPFEGATLGVISSAILRDTPGSLSSVRADAPADLDRIVARCLEKEPRARFQTALDVSNELRRVRLTRDAAAAILKPPPTPSTPLLGREETLDAAARSRARRRARAHRHRLRRHRQDALLDRALPPPGDRSIPAARHSSRSRRSRRRRRCCRPSASRSTSPRRTAARRSMRSAP